MPVLSSEQQRRQDEALASSIVALLIVSASAAATAGAITSLLRRAGFPAAAATLAARMGLTAPLPRPPDRPSAEAQTFSAEHEFRALFIVQSARRVREGLKQGRSVEDLQRDEMRFFRQHLEAARNRVATAKRVDVLANRHGPVLGWYAILDSRTSPECRAAHRQNFRVDERPLIGYPGSVHPHCRCRPGPPHRGARLLASRKKAA